MNRNHWCNVDNDGLKVSSSKLEYFYDGGRIANNPNLSGYGIRGFTNKATGESHSDPFDCMGTGYAKYDSTPVVFESIRFSEDFVDIDVTTGQTRKTDRIYRHYPILEIAYHKMEALWIEDKIRVSGDSSNTCFVMHGMDDVVGMDEGKRLWAKSKRLAEKKYDNAHNFGDTFIEANGSTVEDCCRDGHFIYGMINRSTGSGMGFVHPTTLGVKDWKVWWDEPGLISIEFFPRKAVGKRWLFAVDEGKEQILSIGTAIVRMAREESVEGGILHSPYPNRNQ